MMELNKQCITPSSDEIAASFKGRSSFKLLQETDEELLPVDIETPKKKFFMNTKRNITKWNILGMNLVLFNSLSLLLFYDIAFVYLVQSSTYFDVPTGQASVVIGDVIFWTYPIGLSKINWLNFE